MCAKTSPSIYQLVIISQSASVSTNLSSSSFSVARKVFFFFFIYFLFEQIENPKKFSLSFFMLIAQSDPKHTHTLYTKNRGYEKNKMNYLLVEMRETIETNMIDIRK